MNRSKWTSIAAAAFMAAALTACNDKGGPSLINDAEVNAELATSAGDAMALAVATMIGNESAASLGGSPPPDGSSLVDGNISWDRSRVCYDASFVVVAGCSPISSVRTIVTNVQLDASRSAESEDGLKSWSGAVHRTANDSLTRVFVSTTETQRLHNGDATASDSVTITAPEKNFFFASAATDSVKAVAFNLPRASNPWPVSGVLVRRAAVSVIVTKDGATESKNYSVRIEVTFPADAQGNVQLKVNTTTCILNLVTHAVTNCA